MGVAYDQDAKQACEFRLGRVCRRTVFVVGSSLFWAGMGLVVEDDFGSLSCEIGSVNLPVGPLAFVLGCPIGVGAMRLLAHGGTSSNAMAKSRRIVLRVLACCIVLCALALCAFAMRSLLPMPLVCVALSALGCLLAVGATRWVSPLVLVTCREGTLLAISSALCAIVLMLVCNLLIPQVVDLMGLAFVAAGLVCSLYPYDETLRGSQSASTTPPNGSDYQPAPLDASYPRFLSRFCDRRPLEFNVVASPVILYLALSRYTETASLFSGNSRDVFVIIPFAVVMAVLGVFLYRRTSWDGQTLTFCLFRLAVPAYACGALIIKTIPVDFFTTTLFTKYMHVGFSIAFVLSWVFTAYAARASDRSVEFIAGIVLIECSLVGLLGLVVSLVPGEAADMLLGLFTALFLVCAALSLGRDLIEYSKPVDVGTSEKPVPPDLKDVCHILGRDYGLSPREMDVLIEIAYGHASGYIAKALFITPSTARTHMRNIYKKLGVSSREELLDCIWHCRGE